jgi:hypothetical protein
LPPAPRPGAPSNLRHRIYRYVLQRRRRGEIGRPRQLAMRRVSRGHRAAEVVARARERKLSSRQLTTTEARAASVQRLHARDVDRDRQYVARGMKLGSGRLSDADAPVGSLSARCRAPQRRVSQVAVAQHVHDASWHGAGCCLAARWALTRQEKVDESAWPYWALRRPLGKRSGFAGLSAMARPGLEPGTPRFSVVCSTN